MESATGTLSLSLSSSSSSMSSLVKCGGKRILPPVMTEDRREEMRFWRAKAEALDGRRRRQQQQQQQQEQLTDLTLSVESEDEDPAEPGDELKKKGVHSQSSMTMTRTRRRMELVDVSAAPSMRRPCCQQETSSETAVVAAVGVNAGVDGAGGPRLGSAVAMSSSNGVRDTGTSCSLLSEEEEEEDKEEGTSDGGADHDNGEDEEEEEGEADEHSLASTIRRHSDLFRVGTGHGEARFVSNGHAAGGSVGVDAVAVLQRQREAEETSRKQSLVDVSRASGGVGVGNGDVVIVPDAFLVALSKYADGDAAVTWDSPRYESTNGFASAVGNDGSTLSFGAAQTIRAGRAAAGAGTGGIGVGGEEEMEDRARSLPPNGRVHGQVTRRSSIAADGPCEPVRRRPGVLERKFLTDGVNAAMGISPPRPRSAAAVVCSVDDEASSAAAASSSSPLMLAETARRLQHEHEQDAAKSVRIHEYLERHDLVDNLEEAMGIDRSIPTPQRREQQQQQAPSTSPSPSPNVVPYCRPSPIPAAIVDHVSSVLLDTSAGRAAFVASISNSGCITDDERSSTFSSDGCVGFNPDVEQRERLSRLVVEHHDLGDLVGELVGQGQQQQPQQQQQQHDQQEPVLSLTALATMAGVDLDPSVPIIKAYLDKFHSHRREERRVSASKSKSDYDKVCPANLGTDEETEDALCLASLVEGAKGRRRYEKEEESSTMRAAETEELIVVVDSKQEEEEEEEDQDQEGPASMGPLPERYLVCDRPPEESWHPHAGDDEEDSGAAGTNGGGLGIGIGIDIDSNMSKVDLRELESQHRRQLEELLEKQRLEKERLMAEFRPATAAVAAAAAVSTVSASPPSPSPSPSPLVGAFQTVSKTPGNLSSFASTLDGLTMEDDEGEEEGAVVPSQLEPVSFIYVPQQALDPAMRRVWSRITALARGYLTRRLARVEKVRRLKEEILETARYLADLMEAKADDAILEAQLACALKQQVAKYHGFFFNLSRKEQMSAIARDRAAKRERELKRSVTWSPASASSAAASSSPPFCSSSTPSRSIAAAAAAAAAGGVRNTGHPRRPICWRRKHQHSSPGLVIGVTTSNDNKASNNSNGKGKCVNHLCRPSASSSLAYRQRGRVRSTITSRRGME